VDLVTVFRGRNGVRLAVREASGMSVGRAVGWAMEPVDENGWQAARRTTRVNTFRGGARSGMGQV